MTLSRCLWGLYCLTCAWSDSFGSWSRGHLIGNDVFHWVFKDCKVPTWRASRPTHYRLHRTKIFPWLSRYPMEEELLLYSRSNVPAGPSSQTLCTPTPRDWCYRWQELLFLCQFHHRSLYSFYQIDQWWIILQVSVCLSCPPPFYLFGISCPCLLPTVKQQWTFPNLVDLAWCNKT